MRKRTPQHALPAILVLGLLTAASAKAVILTVQPAADTVTVGQSVTVEVVVDPMDALIGAFDIILGFDPAILAFDSVGIDPEARLGAGALESTTDFGGAFNAAAVSLELDLAPFQDGTPFTLFALTFDAIQVGTSALTLSPGVLFTGDFLSDEFGASLPVDQIVGADVEVVAARVSEPGVLALVLTGLGVLPVFARARRRRSATR